MLNGGIIRQKIKRQVKDAADLYSDLLHVQKGGLQQMWSLIRSGFPSAGTQKGQWGGGSGSWSP